MQKERKDILKAMIVENSADPFLFYALGLEYISENNYLEALVWFDKVFNQFPEYLPNYYHFGLALIKEKDFVRAEEILKLGIKLSQEQKNGKTEQELKFLLEHLEDAIE